MKRIGLYLIGKHEIRESIQFAKLAEENCFESVWQGEEYPPFRHARDSLIPLAAIAAVTKSIRLGTGVLHTWTRNVLTLAMTFATLDEFSQMATEPPRSGHASLVRKPISERCE